MKSIARAVRNACYSLRERGLCDCSCDGNGWCDRSYDEAEAEGEEVYTLSEDLNRCKYDDMRDGLWED